MLASTFPIPVWLLTRTDMSNDMKWLYVHLRYLCREGYTQKYSTQQLADITRYTCEEIREWMLYLVDFAKVLKAHCTNNVWSFSIPPELR